MLSIKEIYRNQVEDGKLSISQNTTNKLEQFEVKLSKDKEHGNELVGIFLKLLGDVQEESYTQGFNSAAQLMSGVIANEKL